MEKLFPLWAEGVQMKTLLLIITIILLFQFMTASLFLILASIALWEILKSIQRIVTEPQTKFFWKEIFNA